MTRTYAAKTVPSTATPTVQGAASPASAPIQAKASSTTPHERLERSRQLGHNFEQAAFSPELLQPSTSGRPLPKPLREKMEAAFATDFSNVRVHEDGNAEQIGALAYTRGHNLHFAPGQFQPHSSEGQKIIGHELTHVMQQRQSQVAIPEDAINTDRRLEHEADLLGTRVAEGKPISKTSGTESLGNKVSSYSRSFSTQQNGVIQCTPSPNSRSAGLASNAAAASFLKHMDYYRSQQELEERKQESQGSHEATTSIPSSLLSPKAESGGLMSGVIGAAKQYADYHQERQGEQEVEADSASGSMKPISNLGFVSRATGGVNLESIAGKRAREKELL